MSTDLQHTPRALRPADRTLVLCYKVATLQKKPLIGVLVLRAIRLAQVLL